MKNAIIIVMMFVCSCATEKYIEVKTEAWTLVDKVPANRQFIDGVFVWLIWKNKHGIKYSERVSALMAEMYYVGMVIQNKI